MQQVIESEIPELSQIGYQVYQYPSRALLNPEKDASVLQDQEISIEPMRSASPGELGRRWVVVWGGMHAARLHSLSPFALIITCLLGLRSSVDFI